MLAVVSLGVPLALSLRDRVNSEVHSQALNQADVVAATAADLVSPPSTRELEALARSSAASVRGRVIIVDAHGTVLADSASAATRGQSYASRPEIQTALGGRAVQTQRASRTLGEDILATAVPVVRRVHAVGAVRITQSVAAVKRSVQSTVLKLVLIAVTVLLLGLLAGAIIARQIALPLRRLEETAKRLSAGDLSARAAVEGSSEQRSLSTSFNEMADRVERMLTAQREFIADASHQLRTPLTALRLRLEESRAAATGAEVQHDLDAGIGEVDRLAAIVEELLVLSRAEDREIAGEAVDLGLAAREAVERWRAAADRGDIAIAATVQDGAVAWCARADLDRAIDVLIENAINYGAGGGEVSVVAAPGSVEVRDRGPGLSEGELETVFERFHRGDAGRRGPRGSGLGLAIARTLARAWQGEATIANRPDGGATARLEFPERRPA